MSISTDKIKVGDISIEIIQKDIKNVHLSVHPPYGRVTISAPLQMDLEIIRLFSISKLGWIKKQQEKLNLQQREAPRDFINRESHNLFGDRYLMTIVDSVTAPFVIINHKTIELHIRNGATRERKNEVIQAWYRKQLKELIKNYVPKLERKLQVKVGDIAIRAMKTKWGTCNTEKKRILLNTELAKKTLASIEYVLTHEIVHLITRKHDDKFIAYMDELLPKWRHLREDLNRTPLGHVDWDY